MLTDDFIRLLPWIAGVFGGFLTVWGAQRSEMKRMKKDVDDAHKKIDKVEETMQKANLKLAEQSIILQRIEMALTGRATPRNH